MTNPQDIDRPSPPSIRLRRMVRHWGLVFLIAVGFLLMALLMREKERTVPIESFRFPDSIGEAA